MSSTLIENRTIRVFISSVFNRMENERDELMKRTFPRLRALAARRSVTLTEVDLRWGITMDEGQSGKVVDICFREIENCIPFFIGIIGDRYGWIPSSDDLDEGTKERYPQTLDYIKYRLSVTEMEMQFGVLERKEEDLHAFFYIKKEHDEKDPGYTEAYPEKLAKLKRAVKSNGRYPVSMYSDPEDLARQVETAFTQLLDQLFPEEESLSALDKERISQRSFMSQLTQSYIIVKNDFDKLDGFLADEEQQYLIVTGESGLGKSALVANWVKGLLEKKLSNRKVICHFIGNGGSLGGYQHVVRTLCAELKDKFELDEPSDERDKDKWSKDDSNTLEMIYSRISVDKDGCLIVLDAVNQLVDVDNAKNMLWLGFPPRNVKVLITTLNDDATNDVFKRRNYSIYELKPLGLKQRSCLVKNYLSHFYGKHLTDRQVTAIVEDSQSSNTLVLRTLLDELVSFGSYTDLDKRIQYYLEPDNIPDFYQRVLERFEDDFGREKVSHALSLISLSRDGLPEDIITTITKLKPLHWSQLYCSLISHLNVKMGLVAFSHRYFSKAILQRYLADRSDFEKELREEIVNSFRSQETGSAWAELCYQYEKLGDRQSIYTLLMRENTFQYFYKNDIDNLTKWWSWLLADPSGLFQLDNYLNIEAPSPDRNLSFFRNLSSFTVDRCFRPELSLKFAEKGLSYAEDDSITQSVFYNSLGRSYSSLGHHGKALDNYLKALSIRESFYGKDHLQVSTLYNNIGLEYGGMGNHKKALECCMKALSIRMSVLGENNPGVATLFNSVGYEYGELGNHKKAREYLKKALSIRLSVYGEDHPDVASSYNNLGYEYGLINHAIALEYAEKAHAIFLNVFGERHPYVATSHMNIGYECGELGDHLKSLEHYEKALSLYLMIHGEAHPNVALAYYSIGYEYGAMNNHVKALSYKRKALSVYLQVYGETHIDVAKSYNNVGFEFGLLGDYENSLKHRLKALEVAEKAGDDRLAANYLNRVGRTYKALGQVDKSNEYFRRSAEKWKELGDEKQAEVSLSEIVEKK